MTTAAVAQPAAADHPTGYVELSDGTKLKYSFQLPVREGARSNRRELVEGEDPVPALFYYQGYGHNRPNGNNTDDPGNYSFFFDEARKAGYAVVTVSVRGAGCSEGRYDAFSRQEGKDGREVIDWISRQPWSNGKVAMVGLSYGGIQQLVVAAEPPTDPHRPDPLVAIAPGKVLADAYRDSPFPGGIPNPFIVSFTGLQAASAGLHIADGAAGADVVDCGAHQARVPHPPVAALIESAQQSLEDDRAAPGWWDGTLWREHSPIERAHLIDVPVLAVNAWQDQYVGSRGTDFLSRLRSPYHAILMNGTHGMYVPPEEILAFLDHYVRGIDNGYDEQPPVRVWWETTGVVDVVEPGWESSVGDWPPPQAQVRRFFLGGAQAPGMSGGWHGRLTEQVGTGPGDDYAYVPGTGQVTELGLEPHASPLPWQQGPRAGASLAYTSAPLDRDMVVLGSASLDLWLASTAPDTDLQVVVTEVRREGAEDKETYVQNGFLRASHRRLDAERSTPTRPYHTHFARDRQDLPLGQPVPMRVEILPFGHVFRKGSRVRVWIEAPRSVPDYWTFAAIPTPARNTVLHDPAHPSSLALSVLPGRSAGAPPPPCGLPARLVCRTDPVTGG